MTDSLLVVDRYGDAAFAAVALRVVLERPVVNGALRCKPSQLRFASSLFADQGKTAGAVAAGAPAARRVLDIRIENVPPPVKPQDDTVRSAPLVGRIGIEKTHQHM